MSKPIKLKRNELSPRASAGPTSQSLGPKALTTRLENPYRQVFVRIAVHYESWTKTRILTLTGTRLTIYYLVYH